jgi:hypothetical protein
METVQGVAWAAVMVVLLVAQVSDYVGMHCIGQ